KNISPKGEDVQRGEKIVCAGEKLTPAHIGLLAACGFWKISVFSKPKAAVIPTGNELVPVEAKPSAGQVRNSTAWAVAAAMKECGVEPSVFEPVPDELDTLTARLSEAIDNFDLVVTCGGVSVGQSDLVREALKQLGAQILFWNLPLRPGKSVLASTCRNKLAIGLSGNPSAALTTFDLLLRPLICDWTRTGEGLLVETEATLTETVQQVSGFLKALRVKLVLNGNQLMAQPTKGQLNTVLSSLVRSDGYALIPPGKGEIHAGATVKVLARKERLTSVFKLADRSKSEIPSEKVRTAVR
ncbi:MAG: molybdopterin molybdotransferase MoeA, partial [Armatimonadota bacterium]